MRKLAREAVIFMLVSMLLGFVGTFIYQIQTQRRNIRSQRNALQNNCDGMPNWGMGIQDVEGSPFVSRSECTLVFGEKKYPVKSFDEGVTISAKDQQDFADALERGKILIGLKIEYQTALLVSAIVGAYCFAAGLGLWLFYRLVRFAVKG